MRAIRPILACAVSLALIGGMSATGPTLSAASAASTAGAARDAIEAVRWGSMGGPPGAGRVMQLIQATQPDHVLYAVTETAVYHSTDQGDTWAPVPQLDDRVVSSLAVRGEELVVCGEGVHRLAGDDLERLLDHGCEAVAADADAIVAAAGGPSVADVMVRRMDQTGRWQDLSPDASDLDDLRPPPAGAVSSYATGPLALVGRDVLAGFRVWVEGSGEHDDGGLYRWDDASGTWSRVELPTPDDVVLTRLVVEEADPRRVIAAFRHPVLHEVRSPILGLVFGSVDGGRTWSPLTDATTPANGVSDVIRRGRAQYLLAPWDYYMLRITGSQQRVLPMPAIEGIPGSSVGLETVLIDRADAKTVYGMPGSAWEFGLVRSTDGMKSWHKMDSSIVASSPTIVVRHPADPDALFTSGNVIQESYATRDGGETWVPFSPTTAGDELRIDPHDPEHMLLVDEMTGLFESDDGGRTFSGIAEEFSAAKVLDIAVAPDDPGRIYVSNLGVGISLLGSDEAIHLSNSPDYAYDIELDPDDSRILYATDSPKKFESHSSVWRYSPDQHEAFGWSEILRVEDAAGITSLRFDPRDHDTLYAGVTGAQGSVWVSHDRGASWEVLAPELTFTNVQGHSQLEVTPGDEDRVIVGTWGGGAYRSADSGRTWTRLDEEHTFSPTCIEVAPSDTSIVYACDRTAPRIHRSLDGGLTWSEYFDFGPGHLGSTAIAIDPLDADVVYAAAFRPPAAMLGSFYRIRDGRVEADVGDGLPRAVLDIAIDARSPSTLYVTTHLHGLYASDDAGATWRRLDDRGTGLPRTGFLDVDVDAGDSATVYATSLCGPIPDYVIKPLRGVLSQSEPFRNIDPEAACGVYRSTDHGQTWEHILETIGDAKGIEVSDTHAGHLYVADDSGGVWASRDGGDTWRQENEGLGSLSVTAVTAGNRRLYAGTQTSGVYLGTVAPDGHIVWDGTSGPRAEVHRLEIEIDPSDPDRLFVSAYPGGVFRSDDGGRTWGSKNFLTPSIRVTDPTSQGYYALELDPGDPATVWLGVYGKGLIVSRDGREFATFANGKDGRLAGKHITSVEVDPANSKRVLVGAEEGVFSTSDAGRTWRRLDRGLGLRDIESLHLVAPSAAPFRADFEDGSRDGFELERGWSVRGGRLVGEGHAWANVPSAVSTDASLRATVRLRRGALHVNTRVSREGRYFVGLREDGVYLARSTDGWQKMRELAVADVNVGRKERALRIDLDGGRIRVYLDGRLQLDYRDRQPLPAGAIAFESLEGSKVTVDDVRLRPGKVRTAAYAGTAGYGAYQLDAARSRWRHLGRTLGTGWWSPWERRMYQFSSLRFDPRVEGRVYLGHFPGGFFISEDGGHSWRDSSVSLGNDGMFSLTQHPTQPQTLFAGTYNGIVKSTDGGATWSDTSAGMPPEQWPYSVAIDADDPERMYTSTKNGQNAGFCHRNEFCGVVMRSTDGGRTWSRIMTGLDPMSEFYTLIIDPRDHDTLYLSTSRGVFASLDGGDRWWPMNHGLPSTHNQVRDNVADDLALSADGRYLYLGLVKHGVWRADLEALRRHADA